MLHEKTYSGERYGAVVMCFSLPKACASKMPVGILTIRTRYPSSNIFIIRVLWYQVVHHGTRYFSCQDLQT